MTEGFTPQYLKEPKFFRLAFVEKWPQILHCAQEQILHCAQEQILHCAQEQILHCAQEVAGQCH